MYFPQKLKQDLNIRGLIPAAIWILIFAFVRIFSEINKAILFSALFFILYSAFSLWIYFRTRNQSYLAASLWQFLVGLFLITHPRFSLILRNDPRIAALLFIFLLASTIWLFYLFFTKGAKWKGREVFELASMSIESESDGFTERPHPAGKAEYTRNELEGFALFLRKNLIAMPYFEENQIVLVPVKMSDEFVYLFSPGKFRKNRSWIAFDFDGNVTVFISRRDYLNYKEELSFDQLCENMGKLFIRFMEYYRKGEAERIITRLNELGLGITK